MNRFLNVGEIGMAAAVAANGLIKRFPSNPRFKLYGVPRGGIPAALALALALKEFRVPADLVNDARDADVIVDDLVDSGATRDRYLRKYPKHEFVALFDKQTAYQGQWLVFPWETTVNDKDESATDNVVRLLQFIGDDPKREGLQETPDRVLKAWKYWCHGYDQKPEEVLKSFGDGAENYDQMVSVIDVPIYSKCEHHMADIFGTVTISYIPDKRIVGLSKLSRLADIFARRLQVQERLTAQIADALHEHLKPKGVGVCIKARHMCMESRGICKQGHHTVTTALRGVMLTEQSARQEFLQLTR